MNSNIKHTIEKFIYDEKTLNDNFICEYNVIHKIKYLSNSLWYPCRYGRLKIVNLLIRRGVDDYNYGLYCACLGGHLKIAEFMIEKGADKYNYALEGACKGGHLELVKLLIENGANDWAWGLSVACRYGHTEIIKLMTNKTTHCKWCNNKNHKF